MATPQEQEKIQQEAEEQMLYELQMENILENIQLQGQEPANNNQLIF